MNDPLRASTLNAAQAIRVDLRKQLGTDHRGQEKPAVPYGRRAEWR
jgi:hypothetical protein